MKLSLFLICILTTTVSFASKPTDHIIQPPLKEGATTKVSEELWLGSKIYERAFSRGCGACHDMSSNPNLVKLVPTLTIDEFTSILKDGKDSMPAAMEAIMSIKIVKTYNMSEKEAIDALYDYLTGRFNGDIPAGKLHKIR